MVEKWRKAPIILTSPITFYFPAINYLPSNFTKLSFTMTLDENIYFDE